MKVPARFFVGILSGLVLTAAIFFGLVYWQLGAPTAGSAWSYDLNTRKQARAASIPQPKLLIVGGSGALFGIKARLLEAELGLPTVNLGTHAVLSTPYILDLGRRAARPGDTVLLVLEYELYESGFSDWNKLANSEFIDYLMARDPAYFQRLPAEKKFDLVMRMPLNRLMRGLKAKFRPPDENIFREYSPYDPTSTDEHGDMTGQTRARLSTNNPAELGTSGVLANGLTKHWAGMADIQAFINWARTNQVRVLATFPNLCVKPAYDLPKANQAPVEIAAFYAALGVPLIGSYRDVLLPRSEFYDTCYHLTEEGATARTHRLAKLLKPYFPIKP